MNSLISDIWPFLLTALLPAVGLYVGYINTLKTKVAVIDKTLENLQQSLNNTNKRMDSHSKKQDDILEAITSLKLDLVRQLGATDKTVSSMKQDQNKMAEDIKNIKSAVIILKPNSLL